MLKQLCAISLFLLGTVLAAFATNVTPNQLIFKTTAPLEVKGDRTGLAAFDSYLNQLGASNLRQIPGMHIPNYFLADVTLTPDWEALRGGSLRFQGIEYVQPNHLSQLHIEPNDPLFPQQFHYVVSNPQAWNYSTGSPLVVVGVVDSGCLIDHPDLQANIWVNPGEIPDDGIDNDGNGYIDDYNGWDFSDAPELADTAVGDYLEQDNDVEDENFHGTHVAGIIGASGNNGIGVSGTAWNVKIMPIRAGFRTTTGQGFLQDDDAAASLIYAADNGCNVVNMSWGDPEYSPIIGDACEYAFSRGVTLVASAGNDPGPYLSFPAKLSSVISVGAVNRSGNIAGFSSYGMDMDLVAPGELVLSTYKTDVGEQYFEQSGTSMSSPFVAGAAALLLSLHPGLSPSDVRARLLTSTDDRGTPGFDMYYGHGILNTRKLLENTSPPLLYITQPIQHTGITGSVDIIGTVMGADFWRYSVMYTTAGVPTILDWYDVTTHQNYPSYRTQQVTDGVLAHFQIPEAFPEGEYTIRVQYENSKGQKYNTFRTIVYDRTPPVLRPESLQGSSRYSGQNLRYYISAVFNEPVRTELIITTPDGMLEYCYGTQMDSLHVWALPPTLPSGSIEIQINATNISNLTLTTDLYQDFMDIQYEIVSSYGYTWQNLGMARVPLNQTYDYDGDGYQEYVAMDLPTSGYGSVFAYQPSAVGHVVTHEFDDTFWLLGAGNTNNTGQELLQLRSDTAVLLESQTTSNYPNLPIWEATSITGGVLADYSGDGFDDILLVKNLPAERVIQAYKRTSQTATTFTARNTLQNVSETSLRNTFVPTIIVKNFDNDNYRDILTADTDGDIMIYEIHNDNLYELSWTHRMPIGNTYSLASGDFDGNGTQDFFIGGYYRDNLDSNLNFWYFEGFKNVSNNSYTSMGSIMFNQVTSQNAIQAMDIDYDGKHELILAISPNLYVLRYVDGEFKPEFHGTSFRTYSILTYKDPNNRPYFLTNYSPDADTVFAVEWTSDDPYTGPPTPINFLANPQNGESVKLSWIPNGSPYYRIYRRDPEGVVELLDNITASPFLDTGLTEGTAYEYAITAYNSAFSPPESTPTLWVNATPFHKPLLLNVEMVSPNELRLMFDQQMASAIVNPTLYTLSHGMEHPTSVNSIGSHMGVHLHFSMALPPIDEVFVLNLNNITSAKGLPLEQETAYFTYEADTQAPGVESVVIRPDKKSLDIVFSESISAEPNPESLQNYELHSPSNDAANAIVSVEHLDDRVRVNLAHQLKHSSAAYSIVVRNLRDLAGNAISLQNNLARFALNDLTDLKKVVAYPNPVNAKIQHWCSFINFPPNKKGRLKIFDSSGNLVLSTGIGPFNHEINKSTWNWELKNNAGHKVSSGIYYYVIEMDGDLTRGKIAVIN